MLYYTHSLKRYPCKEKFTTMHEHLTETNKEVISKIVLDESDNISTSFESFSMQLSLL